MGKSTHSIDSQVLHRILGHDRGRVGPDGAVGTPRPTQIADIRLHRSGLKFGNPDASFDLGWCQLVQRVH